MKILILAPKPPFPPRDGSAFAINACAEGLAAAGASVSVLAMRTEKHASRQTEKPKFIDHYEEIAVDTQLRPAAMASNLLFSSKPYDAERFRSMAYIDALRSLLSRSDFDIIQCEGLVFRAYLDEIRGNSGAKVVLRAHNTEHRLRERMALSSRNIAERLYLTNLAARLRRYETEAASRFDAVAAISDPDAEWFRANAPGVPVILSETGMTVSSAPEAQQVSDGKAGFIGSLNWRPNIEALLWMTRRVWPLIVTRKPDATLHIAGSGADGKTRSLLRGRGIVFEGEVPDAASFTGSMTAMTAPLFTGSGLRIKILEAMSRGKAVVATPAAAEGIAAEHGKNIFIASDEDSFALSLELLLYDKTLRTLTGNNALRLVAERYDNIRNTEALFCFYKNLNHGS